MSLSVHQFIGGGVDLGDGDALVLVTTLAGFIPDRSKFLAVSSPGSVEHPLVVHPIGHGH